MDVYLCGDLLYSLLVQRPRIDKLHDSPDSRLRRSGLYRFRRDLPLVPAGTHRTTPASPTLVTMYCYLQPIVASMLAVLWGMDRFTPTKGAAILLVFVGVYLVNRSKSRAQMEAEALEAARRTAPDAPAMPDVPERFRTLLKNARLENA